MVASSRPDFDADDYVGQLFRVPLDGSPVRRLTEAGPTPTTLLAGRFAAGLSACRGERQAAGAPDTR
ncbi:MAG: hypothetical protein R2742_11575 [Micropruina glycogenica]